MNARQINRNQWWGSLAELPLPASSLTRNSRNALYREPSGKLALLWANKAACGTFGILVGLGELFVIPTSRLCALAMILHENECGKPSSLVGPLGREVESDPPGRRELQIAAEQGHPAQLHTRSMFDDWHVIIGRNDGAWRDLEQLHSEEEQRGGEVRVLQNAAKYQNNKIFKCGPLTYCSMSATGGVDIESPPSPHPISGFVMRQPYQRSLLLNEFSIGVSGDSLTKMNHADAEATVRPLCAGLKEKLLRLYSPTGLEDHIPLQAVSLEPIMSGLKIIAPYVADSSAVTALTAAIQKLEEGIVDGLLAPSNWSTNDAGHNTAVNVVLSELNSRGFVSRATAVTADSGVHLRVALGGGSRDAPTTAATTAATTAPTPVPTGDNEGEPNGVMCCRVCCCDPQYQCPKIDTRPRRRPCLPRADARAHLRADACAS